MRNRNSDGWHVVYGVDVLIRNGKFYEGKFRDKTIYLYRWDGEQRAWVDTYNKCSLEACRKGIRRGTMKFW